MPIRHNDEDDCYKWQAKKELVNIKKQFFKFWVYDVVFIWAESMPNLASILVNHSCKFSLRELTILSQVLTFGELQILVSGGSLVFVEFWDNIVKNDDGSIVEFEKVFELLCCKKLQIYFHPEQHGIGKNTTNKIIEILSSHQISVGLDISLNDVPESFNFNLFSIFLKENATGGKHLFDLSFARKISDAYKNQLQEFVDETIQMRGIYAHTIPLIHFRGQNNEAYKELRKLRYERIERIPRKPVFYFLPICIPLFLCVLFLLFLCFYLLS